MKTLLFILLQAVMPAQGEQAIVYHMPYTEIAVEVNYERQIREAGPYARYARQMLGVDNAVMKGDTVYVLGHMDAHTRTTADANRVYKVDAEDGVGMQLLSLDKNGVLCGYNTKSVKVPSSRLKVPGAKEQVPGSRFQVPGAKEQVPGMGPRMEPRMEPLPAPLSEDALKDTTAHARAAAVAKQILQLREARTYILLGESEHQPSDGAGIEALLRGIDEQERALTALFMGHIRREPQRKVLYYAPNESTQAILGRFDEQHGITDENGVGQPIILTITANPQRMSAATPDKKSKKAPVASPIYYNLPGSADYQLRLGEDVMAERTIAVAQLGVAIPLTRELLTENTHIQLDNKTGNILSITKK